LLLSVVKAWIHGLSGSNLRPRAPKFKILAMVVIEQGRTAEARAVDAKGTDDNMLKTTMFVQLNLESG
jgi:hypothetical protein